MAANDGEGQALALRENVGPSSVGQDRQILTCSGSGEPELRSLFPVARGPVPREHCMAREPARLRVWKPARAQALRENVTPSVGAGDIPKRRYETPSTKFLWNCFFW